MLDFSCKVCSEKITSEYQYLTKSENCDKKGCTLQSLKVRKRISLLTNQEPCDLLLVMSGSVKRYEEPKATPSYASIWDTVKQKWQELNGYAQ